MLNFLRRKAPVTTTGTALDVLATADAAHADFPGYRPGITADEAYDTLPLGLTGRTPIFAGLVAECLAAGTLPAGVA